jgi:mitogen-activated protein kinase kinase
MLEHPWVMEMETKKVDMVKFLTQVWKWSDPKADEPPKPEEIPAASS